MEAREDLELLVVVELVAHGGQLGAEGVQNSRLAQHQLVAVQADHGSTSDRDYNDMIFLFEGVSNTPSKVPEPTSLALLLGGLGLLGATLGKSRRR